MSSVLELIHKDLIEDIEAENLLCQLHTKIEQVQELKILEAFKKAIRFAQTEEDLYAMRKAQNILALSLGVHPKQGQPKT